MIPRPKDWKSTRFNFIKYDAISVAQQVAVKELCLELEYMIDMNFRGRSASTALTKLEDFYGWMGKAIRDQQIADRNDDTPEEERRNG